MRATPTAQKGRCGVLAVLVAVTALLGSVSTANAAYGDDFGLVPDSFWTGTCDLPMVDGSEPVDNSVSPPVSAAAAEKRDCHRTSSLVPQTAIPMTQAGAHPDATATFELKPITTYPDPGPTLGNHGPYPDGTLKDVLLDLPPGLSGDPEATPKCEASDWIVGFCPVASQIGTVEFRVSPQPLPGSGNPGCSLHAPLADSYPQFSFPDGEILKQNPDGSASGPGARCRVPMNNIRAAWGEVASFGFNFHFNINVFTQPVVRTDGDFGVQMRSINIPELPAVSKVTATLWGVPGDPVHAPFRWRKDYIRSPGTLDPSLPPGQSWPKDVPVLPLISNPTACDPSAAARRVTLSIRSWQNPDDWISYEHLQPRTTGCEKVPFAPRLDLQPTTAAADAPSGLATDLELAQNDDLPAGLENDPAGAAAHWNHPDGRGLATSHLDDAVVTLPQGFTLNPSAAAGLEACSDESIGLAQDGAPPRFNNDDPFDGKGTECPLGSKLGTAEVFTPLLPSSPAGSPNLTGDVVLGTPRSTDPESGQMFRMFIVVRNPARGLLAKIAGSAVADRATGRATAIFRNSPQVAFEKLAIDLKGGDRGLFATPQQCGSHGWTGVFTPWSATVLGGEVGGADVSRTGAVAVTDRCGGGFAPVVNAGMSSATTLASGTFSFSFRRSDGEQWFKDATVAMPKGLLASLKNVPLCSDAGAATGSCPPGSRIGSVDAGAGAGNPFFLEREGDVYLTEGYKGAPYGLVVRVPVEAGPFRGAFALEPIVVRQALRIDRTTARVTAASDDFPQVWHGIPLRVRQVTVTIDRPRFMRNPTDCSPKAVRTILNSTTGNTASSAVRFQASGCRSLGFRPRLRMWLTGSRRQMRTNGHPGVRARLRQSGGQANIERTVVRLPRELALDVANAKGLCGYRESLLDEPACPKSSVVGRARAVSPLLNRPLVGPVYFSENRRLSTTGNEIRTLPTLVVALRGEIAINLRASTTATRSGKLVTKFPAIPDAPVSRFDLRVGGGKHGILVVTESTRARFNLCKRRPRRVEVDFDAHNGKHRDVNIRLRRWCGKGRRR